MDGWIVQHSVTNIHCHLLHSSSASQYSTRTTTHDTSSSSSTKTILTMSWILGSVAAWPKSATKHSVCPLFAALRSAVMPNYIHPNRQIDKQTYDIQQTINPGVKNNTRIQHYNNYFYCCYDIQQLLQLVTHNTYQQQE